MKTKNIFRMLLVAAALLMGANNVKAGVEGQIWPANGADNTSDECSISKDVFINAGVSDGTVLRVYCGPITGGGGSFAIRFYANGQNPEFKAGYEATWETQVVTNNQGLINNSYIDLTCSANTATKLTTGGFSATVNGITIKNVAIVDGSSSGGGSTSTTDTPVWSSETGHYLGKWGGDGGSFLYLPAGTFSDLKCDGTDIIRVYGRLGNLAPDGTTTYGIEFFTPDWDQTNNLKYHGTDTFAEGYYDFQNVSTTFATNLKNTNNNGNCALMNGYNFYVTSIVVNPSSTSTKTTPTLTFPQNTYNITYGDSFTGPTATCSVSSLEVRYESSDPSVAEVATYTGAVTIKKAGQVIITARTEASNEYNAASASYVLTVSTASAPAKQDVTLTFSPTSATATMGEAFNAPTLTATANGETVTGLSISYSSSNTSVATVASNGDVTLVAAGTTTITASFAGNDSYNPASASYTLTVNAAAPSASDYIDVSIDGNLASYGYRTYVTPQAVDLSGSIGVQAYYATGLNTAGTEVQFTEVTGVCASGVPLLLKATVTGASEYKLLKSSATGTTPTGNKLQAGQGNVVGGPNNGANKYVLTSHNGSVVFAEVNIVGALVPTDYAYLDLSGSNARGRLSIRLNGESTGISTIQNDERNLDGTIYNLRGQRVENPTKGLYIINGKKVVIK